MTVLLSLYLSWFIAFISLIGSLFFSEIQHLPPCVLCWYQRVLMYPLVPILIVGIIKKDKNLPLYVLPLSVMGSAIALYHNLLQWGIISEQLAPCAAGVSCVTKQFAWFGFITLPAMSMMAFIAITVLMLYYLKTNHDHRN